MRRFRDTFESYYGIILTGLVALTILSVGLYLIGKRPPREFTIATGREGGAYYAYARIYQQRFAELGYTLHIRETAGGVETIELLESGAVDAGFVQNTLLGSTPDSGLSTLAAIYYEPLWTLYRNDLGIQPSRVAELDGLLAGATIPQIQALLDAGQTSSAELVTYYVNRIQRYDIDRLNSVLELNPEALAIAQALDAERAAGTARGPMHSRPCPGEWIRCLCGADQDGLSSGPYSAVEDILYGRPKPA